jgi:hypothetical protein
MPPITAGSSSRLAEHSRRYQLRQRLTAAKLSKRALDHGREVGLRDAGSGTPWRRGAMEPGRLALELLDEQLRHQLAVAWVIGQAREWDRLLQVQEDFIRSSFERMQRLTACCLDLLQLNMFLGISWR